MSVMWSSDNVDDAHDDDRKEREREREREIGRKIDKLDGSKIIVFQRFGKVKLKTSTISVYKIITDLDFL
jgi:hypothetical protein